MSPMVFDVSLCGVRARVFFFGDGHGHGHGLDLDVNEAHLRNPGTRAPGTFRPVAACDRSLREQNPARSDSTVSVGPPPAPHQLLAPLYLLAYLFLLGILLWYALPVWAVRAPMRLLWG